MSDSESVTPVERICVIRRLQRGTQRMAEAVICEGPHRKAVERIGPMAEAELRKAIEKAYPGIAYRGGAR